jgi:hypothetical protein
MNNKQMLMGVAFLAAAGLALFGDKTPDEAVAPPAHAGGAQTDEGTVGRATRSASPVASSPEILALRERIPPPPVPADSEPESRLFGSQNWDPPPPKVAPAPPAPPTAPPLPYAFIGKKLEAGVWEVYLTRGDEMRIVRADSVIDNTYRVGAISPPTMTLTYLPLNQVQQLSIGATD